MTTNVASQTQKIVINSSSKSVSIINSGPMGPRGPVGPSEASLVLDTDGQLLTRSSGVLAPISREDLGDDPAFTTRSIFKNGFVNGGLAVWQRGGAGVVVGTFAPYIADNWQCARNAYTTGMAAGRDTDVPSGEGFRYSLIAQRNAGDTSTQPLYVWSVLDNADSARYKGKTVTLSVYVKAGTNFSANTSNLNVQLKCGTGNDENGLTSIFTGLTTPINVLQQITTSWTRYSFTTTIPSNCTQIGCLLSWTPIGTAGTYDLIKVTGLQIEEGNVATKFEHLPYKLVLDYCLGRFERIQSPTSAYNIFGMGICYSATQAAVVVPYTKKLAKPLIYASSAGNFVIVNAAGSAVTCATIGPNYSTLETCEFGVTVAGGLVAGAATKFHANGTANAIIDITCEL